MDCGLLSSENIKEVGGYIYQYCQTDPNKINLLIIIAMVFVLSIIILAYLGYKYGDNKK